MRLLLFEKAGHLRVGAFRQITAKGDDFIPTHLANFPENDAVDPGLLGNSSSGHLLIASAALFEDRRQELAPRGGSGFGRLCAKIAHVKAGRFQIANHAFLNF
jgi:hypothetical protein